jgi:flagella basal body P-ring formation protein FlgA
MRVVALLLLAVGTPLGAQSRDVLDSLVARIAGRWAVAPCARECVQWSVVHGDSSALQVRLAEVSGSDRSGVYTVTMRNDRFAPPVLVGRLRIGHEEQRVIANRQIGRGELLDTSSIALQRVLAWGAASDTTTADLRPLLGAAARRVIRRGDPVRDADVIAAPVILAGDTITVEFLRDGLRLALRGTALQNASLGARVAIRLDRGRHFAGIATGRNTVRLDR